MENPPLATPSQSPTIQSQKPSQELLGVAGYFGWQNYQLRLEKKIVETQLLPNPGNGVDEVSTEIVEIKLTIKAPFSIAMVTIDKQGNMTYMVSLYGNKEKFTRDDKGKIIGTVYDENQIEIDKVEEETQITKDQFEELTSLIEANEFFSFEEKYVEENLLDATTYTITVNKINEKKLVSCYGKCPEKLIEIRDKIRELWGEEIVNIGV